MDSFMDSLMLSLIYQRLGYNWQNFLGRLIHVNGLTDTYNPRIFAVISRTLINNGLLWHVWNPDLSWARCETSIKPHQDQADGFHHCTKWCSTPFRNKMVSINNPPKKSRLSLEKGTILTRNISSTPIINFQGIYIRWALHETLKTPVEIVKVNLYRSLHTKRTDDGYPLASPRVGATPKYCTQ